ncbi:hypothetical protein BTA51_06335 [Hahella sp. CCB-MM4]|uniref:fructosamine kinase family protein n=1 Tax=Hahella sp. (strain CCB-MM4) TaxID=1926491 RepID=UPI000B9A9BF2|nr:fructosamine kinase family protein [Hahella sp. CCB-MM4]OZG74607.1 hypothetical protein BTA51_06335 [Hahella sp. CCB-MM4]
MSGLSGLESWLQNNEKGCLRERESVGGGCINDTGVVRTDKGESFFLKHNRNAHESMFECEAKSLKIMADTDAIRIPRAYYYDDHCLLLEYLEPGKRKDNYWELFGQQLAAMHRHTAPEFGLDFATFCGTTLQPNSWIRDGYHFFAAQRLMMQGKLAHEQGYLKRGDMEQLERICHRLPSLVPEQPASLVHGDLWSGNAHTGPEGEPVLIDPALYFGWREAELGMTALFGGFPEAFYQAYDEAWPLETGWRERLPLYNLYHLLNHLNLFGGGYLSQVCGVLRRF